MVQPLPMSPLAVLIAVAQPSLAALAPTLKHAVMTLQQNLVHAASNAVMETPLPMPPLAVPTSVAQPTSTVPSPPRKHALMALLQKLMRAVLPAEMTLPQVLNQPALIMMPYPL